jgi:hypothetical protein
MKCVGHNPIKIGLICLILAFALPVFADSILVSENPWGQNRDVSNMTDVFGAGNFTAYTSFASADPAAIFAPSNRFVFLEGGDGTDTTWAGYVNTNTAAILSWVNTGGDLLLQSASWDRPPVTLGPATITGPEADLSSCDTLTAAGISAFTFASTPVTQCGNWMSHDDVLGTGLSVFMTSDTLGNPVVAGTHYGAGYIMYSGLTDSQYHYAGNGLVDDVIAYTAQQGAAPVPEPSTLLLLSSVALGVAGLVRKRR